MQSWQSTEHRTFEPVSRPRWQQDDREARIRQRAFDLWQAEGMPEGKETEHWLAAEREVLLAEPEPTLGVPIALEPASDASKSKVANRDIDGPRKASTTLRPTEKPIG